MLCLVASLLSHSCSSPTARGWQGARCALAGACGTARPSRRADTCPPSPLLPGGWHGAASSGAAGSADQLRPFSTWRKMVLGQNSVLDALEGTGGGQGADTAAHSPGDAAKFPCPMAPGCPKPFTGRAGGR